jgi:hypothetical protein
LLEWVWDENVSGMVNLEIVGQKSRLGWNRNTKGKNRDDGERNQGMSKGKCCPVQIMSKIELKVFKVAATRNV